MYEFSAVVGHESVKRSMQNAVKSNAPSHAYVLVGQKGVGKHAVARAFAKALQCTQKTPDGEACGNCESCHAFDFGSHPDVIYVGLKDKKSIGVTEVREQIVQKAAEKQYKFQYKIFIVEDAHTMTVAAQNALLKTLEEPWSYVVIILLGNKRDEFLPTILSRAVTLNLLPLPITAVAKYLTDKGVNAQMSSIYSSMSQGSIGQALEMSQSEAFLEMRGDILNKLLALPDVDTARCITMAKELEVYKDNTMLFDFLYLWYRDVLVAKRCNDQSFIIQKDQSDRIFSQADKLSLKSIENKLEAIWQAAAQLRQNAGFLTVMEVMLIKLKES